MENISPRKDGDWFIKDVAMNKSAISSPLLINSLLFLVMVYVGRVQEIIPGLMDLYIGKFAVAAVLVLFYFNRGNFSEEQAVWAYPGGKYIVGIGALAVCSIPFSAWPNGSFDFVFSDFFKKAVFVYLIAKIVRNRHDLGRLSWGVVWSVIIISAGTILNPNYKQDRAATGFSYDPNDIALTLVMVLPIIYYLMLEARGWHRWLLLATISTVFYILPMTGSRGGILAFIIVIVLILLKHGIKRLFYLVPVFFLVLFMAFSNSQHLDRYIGITDLSSDYNMDSKFGRIEIWKRTAQLMLNNPLLGCGAGVVSVAEGATHTGKWMTSHNSFLQIGAELGLGGLILHLWIIRSMILLWRKESGALGKGIEVGLYAYCAGGFFLSWAYAYTFYFFVALSIAMARIQAGGGPSTTPTHMKRKFGVHPIDEKVAQP